MNWWEQDPVSGGTMDVAKATADWWSNDPVAGEKQPEQPQMSELDRRMDERVSKEGVPGGMATRKFNQGLPFGSWMDEIVGTLHGIRPDMTIEEGIALERARNRASDKEYSGASGLGLNLAGGLASFPAAPALNLFKGSTLLPAVGNAAATGGAYGGFYGLGQGEGSERIGEAAKGAAIGGSVGGALAPVARGVGNAVGYVRDRMAPAQGQLANYDRSAVNRVLEDFTSDGITPQNYAQKSTWLGEPGMLADMGEDMLLTTNALGNTPGPQMSTVRNAVGSRQDVAPDRIRGLLDTNAGAPRDIPAYMRNQKAVFQQMAEPHYQQFYATDIPLTPSIRGILSRVPKSAFGAAEKLARADGIKQKFNIKYVNDPMTAITGVPGTRTERQIRGVEYDYLKRAIDDLAGSAEKGSNEERVYANLARALRTEVDGTISPTDPTQSPWAIARKFYEHGAKGREGVEIGRKVFQGQGMRPYDLKEEMRVGSAYKQAGIKIGMRDELNSKMGRAATNFGRKGDAAARRALNSEFSRENLEMGVGSIRADRISQGIDAENAMADTFNEVMSNSATAKRQAAQRRLPMTSDRPLSDNTPNTLSAVAVAGARKILNAVTAGALNERAQRIMLDQARMLTARGITRDQVAQELLKMANSRRLTARQAANVTEALNRLMRGAPVAAAESQGRPLQGTQSYPYPTAP